ncbi:porin family protein [Marinoscillum pacificum]|uniref:porin family protein n=1 Tax=Marinoscillum pacificum TaxID=392723 RepID=UPI0021584FE5|nr:porin family protein [Marinoscillum pacificum]
MKNTTLMILMLLTSFAYGQSERIEMKGTNEIGLNYNSWHRIYEDGIDAAAGYTELAVGYGRWVSDYMVVGGNLSYTRNGAIAETWNFSTSSKYYFISNKRLGLYAKADGGVLYQERTRDRAGEESTYVTPYLSAGGGAEYRITPKWVVFSEVSYLRMFSDNVISPKRNFMTWTLGSKLRF